MTLEEFYSNVGADYNDVQARLVDEQKIKKYVKMFLMDDSYSNLIEAYSKGEDKKAIFSAAHTFKGVCLNLSFMNLLENAVPITNHFREGAMQEPVAEDNLARHFEELQQKYAEVIEQIKALE